MSDSVLILALGCVFVVAFVLNDFRHRRRMHALLRESDRALADAMVKADQELKRWRAEQKEKP